MSYTGFEYLDDAELLVKVEQQGYRSPLLMELCKRLELYLLGNAQSSLTSQEATDLAKMSASGMAEFLSKRTAGTHYSEAVDIVMERFEELDSELDTVRQEKDKIDALHERQHKCSACEAPFILMECTCPACTED